MAPPQQERARRTRAAIVESAAAEFAKRGYAAASINAILEHSNATKGAMYFHFDSKEELARAVLAEGLDRYRVITERWLHAPGLDPSQIVDPVGPTERDAYLPSDPSEKRRVIKGGSFLCADNFCFRYRPPAREAGPTDTGSDHVGFRTVLREKT